MRVWGRIVFPWTWYIYESPAPPALLRNLNRKYGNIVSHMYKLFTDAERDRSGLLIERSIILRFPRYIQQKSRNWLKNCAAVSYTSALVITCAFLLSTKGILAILADSSVVATTWPG